MQCARRIENRPKLVRRGWPEAGFDARMSFEPVSVLRGDHLNGGGDFRRRLNFFRSRGIPLRFGL
jgi:hypothetical protein